MSEIHDINCECCKKERSQAVQQILDSVENIIGNSSSTSVQKTIDSLNDLNASSFSGAISDVVKVAEAFLSVPMESYSVDSLKLEDDNKKIGKFFVKDISDIPGRDVTKVVDLSSDDLSGIDDIKISLSSGTIDIKKTISVPFQSVPMRFMINRKGFSYLPVIDSGVKDKEAALEKIKGVKSSQPVKSSTPVDKIKTIAAQKYSSSKDVSDAILSSKTSEEFLNKLEKIGIILFEEVDIAEQINSMLDAASKTVDANSCGLPGITPAPFNVSELEKVSEDCCGKEKDSDRDGVPDSVDLEDSNPIFVKLGITEEQRKNSVDTDGIVLNDIENQLLELNTSYKLNDDELLAGLNTFLEDVKQSNNVMQQCAIEKENALKNYYWFYETQFLNDMTLEYVAARSKMIDNLNGTFSTLEAERIRSIELSIELKQQENSTIRAAYARLFPDEINPIEPPGSSAPDGSTGSTDPFPTGSSSSNYQLVLAGPEFTANITASQLDLIENDATFQAQVAAIRESISNNESSIETLSNQIQDQKAFFGLPSFDENEILNIQSYDVFSSQSILANKTRLCKNSFDIETNPITNQVGFSTLTSQDGILISQLLNLQVHPDIYQETKTLFALNSPESGDVEEYIFNLSERHRMIEDELWSKYYSPQRIDRMFSYLEQGYTSPKPQYSSDGTLLDSTQEIELKSSTGEIYKENVSTNILNLGIDESIAIPFWANLEDKIRNKIDLIVQQIKTSDTYTNYITQIRAAAENEAKNSFEANLIYQEDSYATRTYSSYTNSYSINNQLANQALVVNLNTGNIAEVFTNQYRMVYDSIAGFQKELSAKMESIQQFIDEKSKCLSDQEASITEKGTNYAKQSSGAAENDSAPQNDDCKQKLGSDPFGLHILSDCPGVTKNCYWREYTKLMQIVSLMPIADDFFTGQLTKRLFRYYPVAFQSPVPTPPGVLPTLAMGIPDSMISIPLPIIWVHLLTISTPIGLFVVWITVCGFIPGVYIMYIDEKGQACFMVTPRGSCDIPAGSLNISDNDNKSLLEILPIKDTFRVPLKGAAAKLMGGSDNVTSGDPDTKKSVIDKLKEKIKAAANSLEASDPWDNGDHEWRERAKTALKKYPPDQEAVSKVLEKIEKSIDSYVDGMNIKPIKYPQNAKKLINPIIGPAELVDSFNKLIDSGTDLPSLGLGVKFISIRDELKKLIDRNLSNPDTKQKLASVNDEIRNTESGFNENASAEEKRNARISNILKTVKASVESVSKNISPEMLGFISVATMPIPLAEPCYGKLQTDPIPPYILILMETIKALPEFIDNMSDKDSVFSKVINLDSPLGRAEDLAYTASQALIGAVPDMKFPDTASMTLLKANLKAATQNFFKMKVRMPHVGAVQITIPSALIKEAISGAIKGSFGVISALILNQLADAVNEKDFVKVLAVGAIIKAVFGSDIGSINGNDIKAFLVSSLDSIEDFLDSIQSMLFDAPSSDYKSIKGSLFPPSVQEDDDAKMEVGTEAMLNIVTPALKVLEDMHLPFPLVLQSTSQMVGRLVITKVHPFLARDIMPSWEKLSLFNVPFLIWLDQVVATAQKSSGMGSDYLTPYYNPET